MIAASPHFTIIARPFSGSTVGLAYQRIVERVVQLGAHWLRADDPLMSQSIAAPPSSVGGDVGATAGRGAAARGVSGVRGDELGATTVRFAAGAVTVLFRFGADPGTGVGVGDTGAGTTGGADITVDGAASGFGALSSAGASVAASLSVSTGTGTSEDCGRRSSTSTRQARRRSGSTS